MEAPSPPLAATPSPTATALPSLTPTATIALPTAAAPPSATPWPTASEVTQALTIEEYPVVAEGTDSPNHLEYAGHIDPAILEKRLEWRSLSPEARVASANSVLAQFGYRLDRTEKPGCPLCITYHLNRGDVIYQSEIAHVWPATVNANGDDFALTVETEQGEGFLIRRGKVEPWDSVQHAYTNAVYVGNDLVSLETADHREFVVKKGDRPVYSVRGEMRVDNPVKGLWSWRDRWVLEVDGQVIIDGQSLNQQLGYDEVFGWRLVQSQPFYFFRKGNRIGVSYAGQVMRPQYDEVIHYECCEPAAFNVQGNEHMVWFHALREGKWYYVEMGAYGQTAG